jgi:hypothetical protein
VTVPQIREILSRLLRHPPPTSAEIAAEVSRVLRRHEESRIYHWYATTGCYPPRRTWNDSG